MLRTHAQSSSPDLPVALTRLAEVEAERGRAGRGKAKSNPKLRAGFSPMNVLKL
jgi:hypothetical protein